MDIKTYKLGPSNGSHKNVFGVFKIKSNFMGKVRGTFRVVSNTIKLEIIALSPLTSLK